MEDYDKAIGIFVIINSNNSICLFLTIFIELGDQISDDTSQFETAKINKARLLRILGSIASLFNFFFFLSFFLVLLLSSSFFFLVLLRSSSSSSS